MHNPAINHLHPNKQQVFWQPLCSMGSHLNGFDVYCNYSCAGCILIIIARCLYRQGPQRGRRGRAGRGSTVCTGFPRGRLREPRHAALVCSCPSCRPDPRRNSGLVRLRARPAPSEEIQLGCSAPRRKENTSFNMTFDYLSWQGRHNKQQWPEIRARRAPS